MTRRAGKVTITRADGSVEVAKPYSPSEARRIVGQGRRTETGSGGGAPPWLVAKHEGHCPVCRRSIARGTRIQLRGFEQRQAVHHACAPDWGRRT